MICIFKFIILLFFMSLTCVLTSCESLNSNTDAEEEFLNDSHLEMRSKVEGKHGNEKKQITEQERKAMKEADMWLPDVSK